MTDTVHTPPPNDSFATLDRLAVLTAVTSLCGSDRTASTQLQKGVQRLVDSNDWAKENKRLDRFGLSARHIIGQLGDVLDIPGDLVLMRGSEGGFTLLRHIEQRWQYLAEDGAPLSSSVNNGGGDTVEAVVMKMPKAGSQPGGFSSLTALWPKLRAAWAEVGIACLFINAGQLLVPLFSMLVYDKIAQNGLFETLWAL